MNLGKEFEKYAVKHRGISSNTLHQYQNSVTNLTPYIIEERPMNVAYLSLQANEILHLQKWNLNHTEIQSPDDAELCTRLYI